jgi:3',5'-cyclic AMP phosphodiesterase CpdA
MRLAVLHLSDIHFRKTGNPVSAKVDQIVSALLSADPGVTLCLVIVSGDIAFSGDPDEYAAALHFLLQLAQKAQALRPGMTLIHLTVPGNHDCSLPKPEEVEKRDSPRTRARDGAAVPRLHRPTLRRG